MRNGITLLVAAFVLVGLTAFVTAPANPSLAEPVAAEDAEPLAAVQEDAAVAEVPTSLAEEEPQPEPTPPPVPADCVPASLEERAAQLLVVGLPRVTVGDEPLVAELGDLGVGGVLVQRANVQNADQVRALITALRARSRTPLLVAADEEGGRVSTFRSILGRTPSPRTVAAEATPEVVREQARELGRQLFDLGIDVNLAPVADLNGGASSAIIGDRSFSADPAVASRFVMEFSSGLAEAGVVPTAKHFPGHGETEVDSHVERPVVDTPLDQLQATDLVPFADAIRDGVPMILMAHVSYSALGSTLPASLDPGAYALLRGMGFEGVAISDSLDMGAVSQEYSKPEAAVMAVAAGADAVLATGGTEARAMRDALVAAVRDGRIPEQRLNEAAARVLALKGVDPVAMTCTPSSPTRLAALAQESH
jgi:beta-N-acetylhexosaminidase